MTDNKIGPGRQQRISRFIDMEGDGPGTDGRQKTVIGESKILIKLTILSLLLGMFVF